MGYLMQDGEMQQERLLETVIFQYRLAGSVAFKFYWYIDQEGCVCLCMPSWKLAQYLCATVYWPCFAVLAHLQQSMLGLTALHKYDICRHLKSLFRKKV